MRIMVAVFVAVLAASRCSADGAGSDRVAPQWAAETREVLEQMVADLTATLRPWTVPEKVFLVDDYGAVPDGKTVNTAAIQKAVDSCSAAGGGTVLFPKGDYVTGTVVLKSNVMIKVAEAARILGSKAGRDYPDITPKVKTNLEVLEGLTMSLFYAEGVENIGFCGKGVINGRGLKGFRTRTRLYDRPFVIRMYDSRNIVMRDISLKESAAWMQVYMNCENMIFDGVKVDNSRRKPNGDGMDIDGCRRVIIRNCLVESQDDAICLKGISMKPTEDFLIENCRLYTDWNAFKIGTDTQGDFRRIVVRGCTLSGPEGSKNKYASSGITIASVDGGTVEDMWLYNNKILNARTSVYMARNDRGRVMKGLPKPEIGVVRRVIIENTRGEGNINGGALSGIPGFPIEQVFISNFNIGIKGSSNYAKAMRPFSQGERRYADNSSYPDEIFLTGRYWGDHTGNRAPALPAKGFSLRDVKDVAFEDLKIRPENQDERPLFYTAGEVDYISY